MTRPRSSRSSVPNARSLGLTHPKAQEDLQRLGWVDTQHAEQMWTLAATGDPDLALNNLIRLVEALGDGASELLDRIAESRTFAVRLLGLFGASSMLGDHIVAHPQEWKQLESGMPTSQEMMQLMLDSVEATRVEGAGERVFRAAVTGSQADDAMRLAYRTILARIAAVDVAGTFVQRGQKPCKPVSFELVSRRLSDAADAALTTALAVACAQVYDADEEPARLAVLAMGKCGAQELNYISDVDVIFVAEPADPKATRWAGEFINIGTRVFFEVDAALRPEGNSGALVRTLESHVNYYNRWAETWEFQAQLKARPMTGDMELGQDYVDSLASLVWSAAEREDFVPDVQAMRRRVIENIPDELRARELKLGPGGLRDIEFAVQLLQMVHGRTDESLRTRSTVSALNALAAGGYIGRADCQSLQEDYAFMRLLEHRLQLQRLKRTHTLPPKEDIRARVWLGRTAGCRPEGTRSMDEQLSADVKRVNLQVSHLHSKLFYRPLLTSVAAMEADTIRLSPEAAKRQLAALGYAYPDRAFEHLSALAAGKSRKAKLQAIILPTLLEWLGKTVDPDAGLLNYRKMSEAAHDYSWFLRLLRDENIVGKRLMHILGTSPYASELFLNSVDSVKVLSDGATGPKFLAREPQVVTHSLVAAAGRHLNPDKAIAVARSLRRAELARIAAADLLGFMDVEQVCVSLSWVWDAVLEAALRAEIRFWEDENVANAPARITVIGMGRLGGAELGYGSDADVMFVAQPVEGADESEALKWATSICDSVRTRLGRPSQDPPLDVDIDLRPEGRNGPVVRTLDSYRRYYKEWGETWEMQALLRATWIAGDKDLGIEFLRMIDNFRYPPGGVDDKVVQEVRRMKARVDSERLPRGADRKTHTKLGRGALTDVEWTVQLLAMQNGDDAQNLRNTSTLEMLRELASGEFIAESDADILREAWLTATVARNAIVLVKGKRKDQLPSHGDQLRHVAAAAHWPPEKAQEFLDDYLKKTRKAHRVVDRIFWGEDVGIDYGG